MLQKIRSKTHGAIAWVVIILIGFVFAVWGIEGYVSSQSNVVAEINGEVITAQELQRTYDQLIRQQRLTQALQGGQPVNEALVRQEALGGLVGEKILATTAHRQGFAINDEYVDDLIRGLPQLQNEEGVYAPEKFDALLQRLGYTLPEFRQAAENDLIINQVRGSIVDSAFVLPFEIDRAIKLLEQTRDVSYLLIPAAEYLPQVTVSDEEIKTYYDGHAADFMLPERVSIEYIRLNADDLVIPEPDDQTLESTIHRT
jgi:peptidyl-prolyl cis-trans isomerase D